MERLDDSLPTPSTPQMRLGGVFFDKSNSAKVLARFRGSAVVWDYFGFFLRKSCHIADTVDFSSAVRRS